MGMTPLAYINDKRIRRAMHIIAQERISVAELALRVGFSSPGHFTRTFRKVAGVNPSRYRSDRGR
jgi:AraC family transcriptional regulator